VVDAWTEALELVVLLMNEEEEEEVVLIDDDEVEEVTAIDDEEEEEVVLIDDDEVEEVTAIDDEEEEEVVLIDDEVVRANEVDVVVMLGSTLNMSVAAVAAGHQQQAKERILTENVVLSAYLRTQYSRLRRG
jgi:hypothetical protein